MKHFTTDATEAPGGKPAPILLLRFATTDTNLLFQYLQNLSSDTKKRFGPHPFDKQSIRDFFRPDTSNRGYIALDSQNQIIVAYSIIKIGVLAHDLPRLQSYGIRPDEKTDATFAPSVADAWQGQGLGKKMLQFVLDDLRDDTEVKRLILWGGVQADNKQAVRFYENNGFRMLGAFVYHGENYDMMMEM